MNKRSNIVIGLVIALAIIVAGYFYYSNPAPTTDRSDTTIASTSPSAITQTDNGKTVTFNRGDRFSVMLGDTNVWTLSFSTPGIVDRVKNIMVIRGSQGVFTADNPGTTVLTAEGRPNCAPGQMCAQYIINFTTTIVVK